MALKIFSIALQNDPDTFLVRSAAQAVNFLLKVVIPSTSASRLNLIYVECNHINRSSKGQPFKLECERLGELARIKVSAEASHLTHQHLPAQFSKQ